MKLECEWRHARKRWSREFEDIEKESVWSWLKARQADNFCLCHWGIENWVLYCGVESLELTVGQAVGKLTLAI